MCGFYDDVALICDGSYDLGWFNLEFWLFWAMWVRIPVIPYFGVVSSLVVCVDFFLKIQVINPVSFPSFTAFSANLSYIVTKLTTGHRMSPPTSREP